MDENTLRIFCMLLVLSLFLQYAHIEAQGLAHLIVLLVIQG